MSCLIRFLTWAASLLCLFCGFLGLHISSCLITDVLLLMCNPTDPQDKQSSEAAHVRNLIRQLLKLLSRCTCTC